MTSTIYDILKEYGLDDKEIIVYLALVEGGELNAYSLAKVTGIHRSTTYAIIERLLTKGFITDIQKDEKIFYSSVEIGKLVSKVREKEQLLNSLIPELEKIKTKSTSRVRVFESKESQKQFGFNLINQVKKGVVREIFIISGGQAKFVSPEKENTENENSEMFLERELKLLSKQVSLKKVKIHAIWNEKFKGTELLKIFEKLGENRFLKEIPTLATLIIFGEYVGYLFTMNNKPQVIEIQNKFIAEENQVYFSYLWKLAKK